MPNKLFIVFLLGFSSGLPFLLILSTMSLWLSEIGISKTIIGLFAWVTVPYTGKFIFAPMINYIQIPVLYKLYGQRRSWLLLSQISTMLSIVVLAQINPAKHLMLSASCAFLVGFCSAIQDLTFEAYRIEIMPPLKRGYSISSSVLGYKMGMLFSGAGTIFVATLGQSWSLAYTITALFSIIGIIATLYAKEPVLLPEQAGLIAKPKLNFMWAQLKYELDNFLQTHNLYTILSFLIVFKTADTLLNVMSMPFLSEIGFTKLEIAYVAKSFGTVSMIFGGIIGGYLLTKQSLHQVLLNSAVLQMIACCLFAVQAILGNKLYFLFLTMGLENFSCGICQVALIAYLANLCAPSKLAMHYSILASLASLVRICLSSLGGLLADILAWPVFFILVAAVSLSAIIMLYLYEAKFKYVNNYASPAPS